MKIIATSQVPVQVPYLHLGYTSAGPVYRASTIGPTLSLVAGIAMIWLVGRYKMSVYAKGLLCLLGVIGVAWGSLSLLWVGVTGANNPYKVTNTRMSRVGSVLREQDKNGKLPLPTVDDGLVRLDTVLNMELVESWRRFSHDAWDRPIMLKRNPESDELYFYMVSAGRDGAFDTDDDSRIPISIRREKEPAQKQKTDPEK